MNDTPPKPPHGAGSGASDADAGLEQLRHLLLAPEQRGISEIRSRLDDPQAQAQDVSRVLPAAMRLATARDEQMASAITPAVERALGESVRKNPRILTDTIFPVIGPAIRKAISEAFAKLAQSLNQTLNHSLSVQGLKWRIEAFRTGKTFADVVLARTLIYRVEHVFLIHAKTGLLLQHVQAQNVTSRDPEMIAGMLTAIEDFTHDSFDTTATGDTLEAFEVGDLHVWLENGPRAKIAVVIRGHAPLDLRAKVQIARDRIHAEQSEMLADFEGDAASFEAARPAMEECLSQQVQEGAASGGKPLVWVAAILGVLLLAWLAFSIHKSSTRRAEQKKQAAEEQQARLDSERTIAAEKVRNAQLDAQWRAAVDALKAEPGIVVTEASRDGGSYRIGGLRDPLAADPAAILAQGGIAMERLIAKWEPYFALQPAIILQRAKARLDPPQGVTLDLRDDTLIATGNASAAWIESARQRAASVPGIARLDVTGLADDTEQILNAKKYALEESVLSFSDGVNLTPSASGAVTKIALQIEDLRRAASAHGSTLRVNVVGHASPEGPEQLNSSLARNRAEEIVRRLIENGIPPSALTTQGPVIAQPEAAPTTAAANAGPGRNVTFHVTIGRRTATPKQP